MEIYDNDKVKKLKGWYNVGSGFCSNLYFLRSTFAHANSLHFYDHQLTTFFIKRKYFDMMELSSSSIFYERIGVKVINKFTQNGDIINSLIKKNFL